MIGGKNNTKKNKYLSYKKYTKKEVKPYNKLTRKYFKQRKLAKTKKYLTM